MKKVENEKCTTQDLEYSERTEKRGKRETDTVGPGIWQERLKNVESEKCTVQDLEYVYKIRKRGK